MRFSVITPSYNSDRFLETTIQSVVNQKKSGIDLEYIVVDGGSTDRSPAILEAYQEHIDHILIEPDNGPANAINKGLKLVTGDVVSWLNADDIYCPGSLARVRSKLLGDISEIVFLYGHCPIMDEYGSEIRKGITRFKEFFYPYSSRFTYQCVNYLSQPAMFFTRHAVDGAGPLREDMVAAWDYEYILRLWHHGRGIRVTGGPLAAFRWHSSSISGNNFRIQFKEEYDAACLDAGPKSLQAMLHFFTRWGIVSAYELMAFARRYPVSVGKGNTP